MTPDEFDQKRSELIAMTIDELVKETLVHKNTRLRQEKCRHPDIYSSSVTSVRGSFRNSFCWECGKTWRNHRPFEQEST